MSKYYYLTADKTIRFTEPISLTTEFSDEQEEAIMDISQTLGACNMVFDAQWSVPGQSIVNFRGDLLPETLQSVIVDAAITLGINGTVSYTSMLGRARDTWQYTKNIHIQDAHVTAKNAAKRAVKHAYEQGAQAIRQATDVAALYRRIVELEHQVDTLQARLGEHQRLAEKNSKKEDAVETFGDTDKLPVTEDNKK